MCAPVGPIGATLRAAPSITFHAISRFTILEYCIFRQVLSIGVTLATCTTPSLLLTTSSTLFLFVFSQHSRFHECTSLFPTRHTLIH